MRSDHQYIPSWGGPSPDLAELIGPGHLASEPPAITALPEVSLVRYLHSLSRMNMSVDGEFYPLGSCTMKYNPKIHETCARDPRVADIHPSQPEAEVQGCLEIIHTLEEWLSEITGMDATSLVPRAGAHAELVGLLMIAAYHRSNGELREKILIPDSAHGTNPASAGMVGMRSVEVASAEDGRISIEAIQGELDAETAAVMLTVPNTHGLFEHDIRELVKAVHDAGALVYVDGANLNAILGILSFGELGIDICHLNLHKTFSTPHGGGGPGAGAICSTSRLEAFLPSPRVVMGNDGVYSTPEPGPESVGRVSSYHGNFLVVVRAFVYVMSLGSDGLSRIGRDAVLNANYLLSLLATQLRSPMGDRCMHEFVLSADLLKEETGVGAGDICKRLLDSGIHPPTMYFPLTVPEALLIEPTETESKETLEGFASAIEGIVAEARESPDVVMTAPHQAPVRRLDEVKAAREPVLRRDLS